MSGVWKFPALRCMKESLYPKYLKVFPIQRPPINSRLLVLNELITDPLKIVFTSEAKENLRGMRLIAPPRASEP